MNNLFTCSQILRAIKTSCMSIDDFYRTHYIKEDSPQITKGEILRPVQISL